ncbi:MAG: zinc dependent phospholipase C family protein [Desulfatibacillaceae bacterium]|nr:zinc dependent phospholipase C family protein [Desulfatibacillaceae bacterium]
MPKELTHWVIAKKALDRLEPGPVKQALSSHFPVFLLGATAPDTPMYALLDAERFTRIAKRLHGSAGEDTFDPPARVLRQFRGMDAAAFALGVVSHVMTDAIFHPWIMYYSGGCHEQDDSVRHTNLFRHRLIESWLDLHYARQNPSLAGFHHRRLFRDNRAPISRIASFFSVLFGEEKQPQYGVSAAIYCHSLFHWAFTKGWIGFVARGAGRFMGKGPLAFVPLFHPGSGQPGAQLFSSPISYRHPVTGRARATDLAGLETRASAAISRIFSHAQQYMEQGNLPELFERLKGPSLESGLVGRDCNSLVFSDIKADLDKIIFSMEK